MRRLLELLVFSALLPVSMHAQEKSGAQPAKEDVPAALPARPTVTSPAELPPVGYLQFEQGFLQGGGSSGLDDQFSLVQNTKIALTRHLQVQSSDQPYARTYSTGAQASNDPGDLLLGVQYLFNDVEDNHTGKPSLALAFDERVRTGSSADLDIGSSSRGLLGLVSGDFPGLHYDLNVYLNEQPGSGPSLRGPQPARRAQTGQSLALQHPLTQRLSVTGELYHFTQPLVHTTRNGFDSPRSNQVGLLSALGYTYRPNLVFDLGADRGITPTSTVWEGFAGFTYLLPHRIFPDHKR